MSRPLVWITGAGGLIGGHLARSAARFVPGWDVAALTRADLDLADRAAVALAFAARKPSMILHCAALSRGPACQSNPSLAEKLNVAVTRQFCELASDIPLLFFSTDLVFDGRKGDYVETDPVSPLSIYAETKVRAEQFVLRNPLHSVVRLSLNAGVSAGGGTSFTELTRRAWAEGQTLKLFTDEYRCPMAATVTAKVVWELMRQDRPGLYHLAGSERLSRWEIGRRLAERWPELPARMEPASIRDHTGPARPADTSLDCAKIQSLLTFPLPGFSEWLREHPGEPV